MELAWSAEDLQFRDEVRAFLDAKLTPECLRRSRGEHGLASDPA